MTCFYHSTPLTANGRKCKTNSVCASRYCKGGDGVTCSGICTAKKANGLTCDGNADECLGGGCYCHTCRSGTSDGQIGE